MTCRSAVLMATLAESETATLSSDVEYNVDGEIGKPSSRGKRNGDVERDVSRRDGGPDVRFINCGARRRGRHRHA